MSTSNELKNSLKSVNMKLDIIKKQTMTPDRLDEMRTLNYEKDQLEYDIRYGDTEFGKPKIKKEEKNTPHAIAKMVRSVKGSIRM